MIIDIKSTLYEIYEHLHKVYKKEIKPFKIHYQLSEVFETHDLDFETYEDKLTYEARKIKQQVNNSQFNYIHIINNEESICIHH